jgi:hypothetical protein
MVSGFKTVLRRVEGLKVAKDKGDAGCSKAITVQRLTACILHITIIFVLQTYQLESVD